MPYKSEAQRKYFNANRKKLEAEGVDVDHWNEESKGKTMPEKKAYAADTSFADDYDDTQLREALAERVRMIAQLRAHRDSLLDAQSGYMSKGKTMPDKKANYSAIQNLAWMAAEQEKSAGNYLRNSLIGAGIGGVGGGIADWMNDDPDKPDDSIVDGILSGATTGGLTGLGVTALRDIAGASRADGAQFNSWGAESDPGAGYAGGSDPGAGAIPLEDLSPEIRDELANQGYKGPRYSASDVPSSDSGSSKSLADVLPKGYRRDAQRHAENYRNKGDYTIDSAEIDKPFLQNISDKALDRKVKIRKASPEEIRDTASQAAGDAAAVHMTELTAPQILDFRDGRMRIVDAPGAASDEIVVPEGPTDRNILAHELTHGTQDGYMPGSRRFNKRPFYEESVKDVAMKRGLGVGDREAGSIANYLTSANEEEAYLAQIKRRYYEATGKHVTNQKDARKALEWAQKNPDKVLFDQMLEKGMIEKALGNGSSKETWIRGLMERMPGLVNNKMPNSGIKTAGLITMNFSDIKHIAALATEVEKQASIGSSLGRTANTFLEGAGKVWRGAKGVGKQTWAPVADGFGGAPMAITQNLGQSAAGGAAGYYGTGAADPEATSEQKWLGAAGGAGMASPFFRKYLMDRGVAKFHDAPIAAATKANRLDTFKPMSENAAKGLGLASGAIPAFAGKAGLIYGMGAAKDAAKGVQGFAGAGSQLEDVLTELNKQPNTVTITDGEGNTKQVPRSIFEQVPSTWNDDSGSSGSATKKTQTEAEQVAAAQEFFNRPGATAQEDVSGITALNRAGGGLNDAVESVSSAAGNINEASKDVPNMTAALSDAAEGAGELVETGNEAAKNLGNVAEHMEPAGDLADTLNQGLQSAGKSFESFKNWVGKNGKGLGLGALGAAGLFGVYKLLKSREESEEEEEDNRRNYVYRMPKRAADFGKLAAGRCWEGYEPVPGKKAYSDGSCQPAGGKKKKKKKSEKKSSDITILAKMAVMQKQAYNTPLATALTIAPHSGILGGAMGAAGGGLHGLLKDPGYDEETGDKKSRIMNALKGMGMGGVIGGAGGALFPPAAVLATQGYGKYLMPLHERIADLQTAALDEVTPKPLDMSSLKPNLDA